MYQGRFLFVDVDMNGAVAVLLVLTPFAVAQSDQNANPSAEVPLVALELPAEAVAYHLGLKSWAFTYEFYVNGYLDVGLSYYERGRDGTLKRINVGQFSTESDLSGRQDITVILGPNGERIPISIRINDAQFVSEIANTFDLDSFNSLAPTTPNSTLPSTVGTFILMARYLSKDGNVTVTGNPGDMEAYLALEVGAAGP